MAVFFLKRGTPPVIGTPLSDYAEETVVKVKENGYLVDFYVSKHNYESGLNGPGRTLLVRKDAYDSRQWNNGRSNAWAASTLLSWLNGDYKAILDPSIHSMLGATKYYYTVGQGDQTIATRSDAVFIPSATELGLTIPSHMIVNTEGTTFTIANTLKTQYQWTRSPDLAGAVTVCNTSGNAESHYSDASFEFRPVFTVPSTTLVDPNTNEIKG